MMLPLRQEVNMDRVRLHILIPAALRSEIRLIAERDGVTMTAVIIAILWRGVRYGA